MEHRKRGQHTTKEAEKNIHHVLCAEDDPDIREILDVAISSAGYEVEVVGDGMEALRKVVSDIDHYDLLITDHRMPRMDGLTLVRHLRDADFPGKILILAGTIGSNANQIYSQFHIDGIVRKPILPSDLIETIAAISREPRLSHYERQKRHSRNNNGA
jgi:two-component system chemotaxis response regulator CheY